MTVVQTEPNWFQRLNKRFAYTRVGTGFYSHTLHHLDRMARGLSGGRYSAAGVLGGLPIVFVTTTGAKSGQSRTVPLIAVPDDRRLALIASNWGRKGNPAWYYNVTANPEVIVEYRGRRAAYRAHRAAGGEREAFWEKAAALYPGYTIYREKAGEREIPVIILDPHED
jgi:deazaflavin-dependent oxidoreductase (nitroreductase family)